MLRICILLLICANFCENYRILGIFPHFGKSHFDIFAPLMRGLAEAGHDVTVLSHFPQQPPLRNYRDLVLKLENSQLTKGQLVPMDLRRDRLQKYWEPLTISQFAQEGCEKGLASSPVQTLLETKEGFDVVIVEAFNTDCYLALVHRLNSPFVQISSSQILPWFYPRFAIPLDPAYIPSMFLGFGEDMTFLQRVENSLVQILHGAVYRWAVSARDGETARRVLGAGPPLEEIAKNASLVLVNSHFSLTRARPAGPAVVEIGGIHLPKKISKLPKNIENWINGSKHGVIYFSMGSMIKGHTFPPNKRQAFLGAFGRLPQRVLWKWENDTMPGKPENVMIQKWMPQFDILCHPNVVAYISHGGLLGMTEAVHCGVPAVVLPQFGDQFTNARALQASGGGLVLDFNTLQEDQVYDALNTILAPEFQEKTKRLSERFRDRPMSPLDTAIYWVEYVARHKGAHHLRTAAVGMPWHQYLLLDVIAFLVLIPSLILYVSYLVCCKRKGLARGADKTKIKTN